MVKDWLGSLKTFLMKYGALLIGFEYHHTRSWETLPGIPVDLYQMYKYITTLDHFDKIVVYTDLVQDHETEILKRAILDGYVNSGLLSFVEDVKTKSHYHGYTSQEYGGYSVNNFDETLINFVRGLDRLFLYYTGHGKLGDIILPDGTHVGMEYIKSVLNQYPNTGCEIISIFDCCGFDGQSLTSPPTNPHISIGSTTITQEISTSKSGSEFTRLLIQSVRSNRSLMDYQYVFVSHPNIKYLWNWIYLKHNNISIQFNDSISVIKVTLHNCQPDIESSTSFQNYLRYY